MESNQNQNPDNPVPERKEPQPQPSKPIIKKKEPKKVEENKEEEVYFACNVLDKFDANHVFDKVNDKPPQKNIDA